MQGSEGAGSANSSPFHKVLSPPDSNNTGGAAGDDVPIHMDEPDYFVSSEKLGKIQFSLSYDFHEMTLTLRIIRAVELPAKDFSGTSDPYVKILLLPDKKHKLTTNIKRRNLNPRWNEVFAFEGEFIIMCSWRIIVSEPGSLAPCSFKVIPEHSTRSEYSWRIIVSEPGSHVSMFP